MTGRPGAATSVLLTKRAPSPENSERDQQHSREDDAQDRTIHSDQSPVARGRDGIVPGPLILELDRGGVFIGW